MTTTLELAQSVGDLLRQWRRTRLLSQNDLARHADISARHLSFIENNHSTPSRETILRLAETLHLPLRERNQLLLTAGYAPLYHHTDLHTPHMTTLRTTLHQLLQNNHPHPTLLLDRYWDTQDSNQATRLLTQGADPHLLQQPMNLLRLTLHPDGLAPRITNLGQWRAHLLTRLRHQITTTNDPQLTALHDELNAYPCHQPQPRTQPPTPGHTATPLHLRHHNHELTLYTTTTTFPTALDITTDELTIETFLPADTNTTTILHTTTW